MKTNMPPAIINAYIKDKVFGDNVWPIVPTMPTDIDVFTVEKGTLLIDALASNKIVSSKGEFRRLVGEHAITNLDKDEKITDPQIEAFPAVYRVGKKRFCKIVIK